ncbi:MAG: ABC transporter permease, partial [Chloracidobacterium sp.]|nr:ABC transporter permease [Chloracidobacterium sp.]
MFQDIRIGLRMLLKDKGFTVVAALTLALGIGANTAMFSVLNTYLFRTLPYPDSGRLVRVYRTSIHSDSWPHSPGNFFDQREKNNVFDKMVAYSSISPNLADPGQPAERLSGIAATSDFFPALGVKAALGRVFVPEDHETSEFVGAGPVAVLSDRFWMRRFGGDPNVIGRTLRLDGQDVKVVGVMPPGFDHPLLWGAVDVWRPLAFNAKGRSDRGSNWLRTFARLKPGVSIEQADQAMKALAAAITKETSQNQNESLRLEPFYLSMSDDIGRKIMWFALGLAGFVLLIGCANLANLQLVRTAARAREFAVRAALGSGRLRLLRQSLVESLIIGLMGGALSLLLALWGVNFISHRLFTNLPGAKVSIDFGVFGFALLCSALTGLIFGTVPAWLASRADVNQALRENARGSSASRSQQRLRSALIVGEVTFALVLLSGAGLFLRGVQRFANLDPGWRVDGLVTAEIGLPSMKYKNPEQRMAFYQQLEARLATLPGVDQVAISGSQPVWGLYSSGSMAVEGRPDPQPGQYPEIHREPVSAGYFGTLGIRLLSGRAFNSTDIAGGAKVVIINETTARRFWPNESPIGKRIGGSDPKDRGWREIVGVVNDVGSPGSLGEPYTRLQSFYPLSQNTWENVNIFLRASAAPETLTSAIRGVVAELDPTVPAHQILSARALVERGMGSVSLLGHLLGAFAALGLALAAVGIYGVISYSVVQRTGEIGIRMALGAETPDVLRLVLGKGARLILIGALLGFGGAYAVARFLAFAIP